MAHFEDSIGLSQWTDGEPTAVPAGGHSAWVAEELVTFLREDGDGIVAAVTRSHPSTLDEMVTYASTCAQLHRLVGFLSRASSGQVEMSAMRPVKSTLDAVYSHLGRLAFDEKLGDLALKSGGFLAWAGWRKALLQHQYVEPWMDRQVQVVCQLAAGVVGFEALLGSRPELPAERQEAARAVVAEMNAFLARPRLTRTPRAMNRILEQARENGFEDIIPALRRLLTTGVRLEAPRMPESEHELASRGDEVLTPDLKARLFDDRSVAVFAEAWDHIQRQGAVRPAVAHLTAIAIPWSVEVTSLRDQREVLRATIELVHATRGAILFAVKRLTVEEGRPRFGDGTVDVGLDGTAREAVLHEGGHALEELFGWALSRHFHSWISSRRTGSRPVHLGRGYGADEFAYAGRFVDPYVGKVYRNHQTEVLSVGLERFASAETMRELFNADVSHFFFVLGTLALMPHYGEA